MSRSWKEYCSENNIPSDNSYHFFLVYCDTTEKMEKFSYSIYQQYGINRINANPGSIPRGPWLYVSLNGKLQFHGNIGVDVLGEPVIGNHAITMDEFIIIANIYQKYENKRLLVFD